MVKLNKVLNWNSYKIGLVLSGGGAKGAYEAGVMTALDELDISEKIKVVSGTSIGAINSLAVPMGQKKLCESIWHRIGYRDVIPGKDIVENLMEHAKQILSSDGIKDIISRNIDLLKLRKSGIDLYACAYSLSEKKPEYFHLNEMSDDEIVQAVLASAAIPRVFPPVEVRGQLYVDGGINDPSYPGSGNDLTPTKPLAGYKLDMAVVVRLSAKANPDYDCLKNMQVVEILPSGRLETIRGTGTMDFTKSSIKERIEMGYMDALTILSPMIMKLLTSSKE